MEGKWGSWLKAMPIGGEFTVCPKCRIFSFNDAYALIIEQTTMDASKKVKKK